MLGQCLVANPGDRGWEMCNGQWRLSGLRSRGRQGLIRVAHLQVQEDLQGKLQVSQGESSVHFILRLRWTVLREFS